MGNIENKIMGMIMINIKTIVGYIHLEMEHINNLVYLICQNKNRNMWLSTKGSIMEDQVKNRQVNMQKMDITNPTV